MLLRDCSLNNHASPLGDAIGWFVCSAVCQSRRATPSFRSNYRPRFLVSIYPGTHPRGFMCARAPHRLRYIGKELGQNLVCFSWNTTGCSSGTLNIYETISSFLSLEASHSLNISAHLAVTHQQLVFDLNVDFDLNVLRNDPPSSFYRTAARKCDVSLSSLFVVRTT